MSGRSARSREMPEAKHVNVVVSRYALALQRKNQKLRSNAAKPKVLRFRDEAIHMPPMPSTRQAPPAVIPYRIRAIPSSKDISTQSLYLTPRPTFPTRISIQKGSNHQEMIRSKHVEPCIKSSCIRYGDVVETKAHSSHANTLLRLCKADEMELLQSIHYQLCHAEAKAENTFRRQEQQAQSQLLAAWKILQSKLRQLQKTAIGLDCQQHANLMKTFVENVTEPSALLAVKLPRFLDSITQLCTSVQIAVDRLSYSDNPFQLKQQMESLTLELDNLVDWIQATNTNDSITSTISTDQEMQRLAEQLATALLQIAHLATELRVGSNSGTQLLNSNENDNLD